MYDEDFIQKSQSVATEIPSSPAPTTGGNVIDFQQMNSNSSAPPSARASRSMEPLTMESKQ